MRLRPTARLRWWLIQHALCAAADGRRIRGYLWLLIGLDIWDRRLNLFYSEDPDL